MTENKKQRKMTLTVPEEFYSILEARAALEFIPPSTYVRRELMQQVLKNNSMNINETNEKQDQ